MTERSKLDSPGARAGAAFTPAGRRPPRLRGGSNLRAAALAAVALAGCATAGGGSPSGSEEKPDEASSKLMEEVGGKAKGIIVWSSSRLGNHDLFVMNTDGSNVQPITHGDSVDWFPRFSPDGTQDPVLPQQEGLGVRARRQHRRKWDIYTVTPDGKRRDRRSSTTRSWGTWISDDEIVYVRGRAIVRRKLADEEETRAGRQHEGARARRRAAAAARAVQATAATSPSPCAARSARPGSGTCRRRPGRAPGAGCQINWSPTASDVYWVHPTGNGGSRVFHMPIKDGKPAKERRRRRRAHVHRHPGPPLARYFPAAVGRRQLAGVGGSPSAVTITTSPTTRSTCGRWARRPRRRRG